MNIKSLLLGSAAALVAVSGARAADAVVVAEPEPAEYVRICDVYGAGYFYIPGTETCLRISGYVRYDASAGSRYSVDGLWNLDKQDDDDQGAWKKTAKIVLNADTGQETEYGTLATHIGIVAVNSTTTDTDGSKLVPGYSETENSASLDSAYIKLGGLMIGYADSLFASWTGFAGAAINDSIIQYGDNANTNQINYTFDAGNGFSAIIGLEQGYEDTIDSYVPHVLVGAKFTQGWGGVSGIVAYNSVYEEWAGKVRVDFNVNDQFSLFVMGGYGSGADDHFAGTDTHTAGDGYGRFEYKPWGGDWAVWGGGSYKASEKATLYAQAETDDAKDIGVAVGVAYELVPGFVVKPELNYNKIGDSKYNNPDLRGEDGWGGIIRFQRNF